MNYILIFYELRAKKYDQYFWIVCFSLELPCKLLLTVLVVLPDLPGVANISPSAPAGSISDVHSKVHMSRILVYQFRFCYLWYNS